MRGASTGDPFLENVMIDGKEKTEKQKRNRNWIKGVIKTCILQKRLVLALKKKT